MGIKICLLQEVDNFVETVELIYKWQYEQWSDEGVAIFANSITTFVASNNDVAIGCAALVKSDLPKFPTLSPWLAGVYVTPNFRHLGIASDMINKIENIAIDLNYKEIYLYSSLVGFYNKKGWTCINNIPGTSEFIMKKDLINGIKRS